MATCVFYRPHRRIQWLACICKCVSILFTVNLLDNIGPSQLTQCTGLQPSSVPIRTITNWRGRQEFFIWSVYALFTANAGRGVRSLSKV